MEPQPCIQQVSNRRTGSSVQTVLCDGDHLLMEPQPCIQQVSNIRTGSSVQTVLCDGDHLLMEPQPCIQQVSNIPLYIISYRSWTQLGTGNTFLILNNNKVASP